MNTSSASAPLTGTILSERYALTRLIARGGMGDVYEATDGLLQRQVAVKVFRQDALADRSRFDTEVRTLAALSHPGLVQVFDAGEHRGHSYVVLELIDGPSLRSVLADGQGLSPTDVGAMGSAITSALAYVHSEGVVHRDVTPSNILRGSDGRHRLADFGIARLLDTTRVTAAATTLGTVAYMAPEQVEGRDVTPAADVYALGLVLIEALTGHPAFVGVGHEVALARLARDPDIGTEVPTSWRSLLAAMTARDPGERPSAAEVTNEVASLASRGLPEATRQHAAAPLTVAAGQSASDLVEDTDGHAPTEHLELKGGTAVMPAALMPALMPEASPAHERRALGSVHGVSRRRLWLALAVLVAVVLAALASGNEIRLEVPTATTQPGVVTVPTTSPTTSPPTTTASGEGKDNGKGNGRDKDD